MFGFLKKALLRFARAVVDNVLSQLTQQLNIVETLALSPMRAMLAEVEGGQLWRGEGADAFVQEVSHLMLPGVGRVKDGVHGFHANLQRASNLIEQADQRSQSLVHTCVDQFDKIYRH